MSFATDQRETPRIWLLDIDGTLMPSHDVDNECYWSAVHDCIGGAPEPVPLDAFADVTDTGILDAWMRRTAGRPPTPSEQAAVRSRFLERLGESFVIHPEAFRPTPGLEDWLDGVLHAGTDRVGLATGGWGHSAEFKLRAAGLDRYRLPMASSDDSHSRTAIMGIARQRALAARAGTGNPAENRPTTYIGDGIWDLAASRELGWDFIGIATGVRLQQLQAAGAATVLADFRPLSAALSPGVGSSGRDTRATA